MRECDSSSKAANLTRRFGSSAPGFWREPFASSATTSPSHPETQLQPKWGYKCSGGDFRRSDGLPGRCACRIRLPGAFKELDPIPNFKAHGEIGRFPLNRRVNPTVSGLRATIADGEPSLPTQGVRACFKN